MHIPTTKFSGEITEGSIIGKYACINRIGCGSFGTVYRGVRVKSSQYVAIKIGNSMNNTINPHDESSIKHETTILNYLYSKSCRAIPYIYWFGLHETKPCLVMTYYDCSLLDVIRNNQPPFIKETVNGNFPNCNYIIQSLLLILKSIHEAYVVHRDIKPQNVMVKNNALFLIDFGMATFYIDENSNHIKDVPQINILGTPTYISYNVHSGHTYTRRDDIISLAYMYMGLAGCLFWKDHRDVVFESELPFTNINHPKNQYIRSEKELSVIQNRFESSEKNIEGSVVGKSSVYAFLKYAYMIDFDETPQYTMYLISDNRDLPEMRP